MNQKSELKRALLQKDPNIANNVELQEANSHLGNIENILKEDSLKDNPELKTLGVMEELRDSLRDYLSELSKPLQETSIINDRLRQFFENVRGEKGDQGDKGEKGDQGEKGKDGKDGKDGKNGKDGKDGENGRNGIDGIDGKDGKDGKDGEDGKVEEKELITKLIAYIKKEKPLEITHLRNGEQFLTGLPKRGTRYKLTDQRWHGAGTSGSANIYVDSTTTTGGSQAITLTNTPVTIIAASLNGQIIYVTTDYTLSGATFTLLNADIPAGLTVQIVYAY